MRTIIAISLLILLATVACGSEAPEPVATAEPSAAGASALPTNIPVASQTIEQVATPTPTATPEPTPISTAQDPDRAALLKEFAQLGGDAFARREWAIVHALYPDEFRAKCSLGEFAAMTAFLFAFAGIPEDITYVFESARVEGNHGYIDSHYAKDGLEIDLGGEEEADPHALWRDGEWTVYQSPEDLAEEDPCSFDFTAEDTPTTPITSYVMEQPVTIDAGLFDKLYGEPELSGEITLTFTSVLRAEDINDNFCGSGKMEAEGVFVAIYYSIRNDANSRIQPATQINSEFVLMDDQERQWEEGGSGDHCFLEANFADKVGGRGPENWVGTGFSGVTTIVFDVPDSASGLRLISTRLGIEVSLEPPQ